MTDPTHDEIPWDHRTAKTEDVLAAFAFLLRKAGAVELDTAEMAGMQLGISARFVARDGKILLIVEPLALN